MSHYVRTRLSFIILGLIQITTGALLGATNSNLTVEDVLAHYEKTLDVTKLFSLKAETSVEVESTAPGYESRYGNYEIQHYRDHDRIDTKCIARKLDKDGNILYKRYEYRGITNNWGIRYTIRSSEASSLPTYRTDGHKWSRHIHAQLHGGETLDGQLSTDDDMLPNILHSSSELRLMEASEEIAGNLCYVVEAKGDYGHYRLWLDPRYGYVPRKIVAYKTENDKYGETLISSKSPVVLGDSQPVKLEAYTFTCDSIKIEKIGDYFLPTACTILEDWTYSGGLRKTARRVHKRLAIDLAPNFTALGAFVPDLPDGTPINHQNYVGTGIRCEWRDGRVVTNIDAQLLESIDNLVDNMESQTMPSANQPSDKLRKEKIQHLGQQQVLPQKVGREAPLAQQIPSAQGGVPRFFWWVLLGLFIILVIVVCMFLVRRRYR